MICSTFLPTFDETFGVYLHSRTFDVSYGVLGDISNLYCFLWDYRRNLNTGDTSIWTAIFWKSAIFMIYTISYGTIAGVWLSAIPPSWFFYPLYIYIYNLRPLF